MLSPDTSDDKSTATLQSAMDNPNAESDEDDTLSAPTSQYMNRLSADFSPPHKLTVCHFDTNHSSSNSQSPSREKCSGKVDQVKLPGMKQKWQQIQQDWNKRYEENSQGRSTFASEVYEEGEKQSGEYTSANHTVPTVLLYNEGKKVGSIANATLEMEEYQQATPGVKMTDKYLGLEYPHWENKTPTDVAYIPETVKTDSRDDDSSF